MTQQVGFTPGGQPVVVNVVERRSNGMGIAGFVLSLLGLLSGCFGGFVLSPLGLILSAIGLKREPRGLAITGLILGIVGTAWMLIAVLFLGGLTAALGGGVMALMKDGMGVAKIQMNTRSFYTAKQHLPANLAELTAAYPDTPTSDRKGNPIEVDFTQTGGTIKMSGLDGKMGTADDVVTTFTVP